MDPEHTRKPRCHHDWQQSLHSICFSVGFRAKRTFKKKIKKKTVRQLSREFLTSVKADKEERKHMFILKADITGHSEAGVSTVYFTEFEADFIHHKNQSEHHCIHLKETLRYMYNAI